MPRPRCCSRNFRHKNFTMLGVVLCLLLLFIVAILTPQCCIIYHASYLLKKFNTEIKKYLAEKGEGRGAPVDEEGECCVWSEGHRSTKRASVVCGRRGTGQLSTVADAGGRQVRLRQRHARKKRKPEKSGAGRREEKAGFFIKPRKTYWRPSRQ